jgi:hypothetical protein
VKTPTFSLADVLLRILALTLALVSLSPVTSSPISSDLEQAHAFPVPFVPSRGQTDVTFTNLSSQTTIRIFDIDGKEVRSIDANGATQVWDARNNSGEEVASGVYLYLLSDAHETKAGKLMVIR